MKYLSLIIILFLFLRCNNATDEAIQKSEQDSVTAETISLRLASPAEEVITLAAATTEVTKIIQANKDTMWVIVSSDCSQTVFENHPFQVAPPPPTNNVKPVIKTGPDQITSGTTVTLNGSGSTDPDGTIVKFVWTQEKGNPAILVTVGAVCNVSGLLAGDYRFRLTITDNSGGTNSDTIHVKKTGGTPPPPGNQAPVVSAGANQTTTGTSVTLSGSATDGDGTIVSYQWSKASGPAGGAITSPASAQTTVTSLVSGVYVFSLKATDNGGASASKNVTVTVSSTTPPVDPPPTAGYTLVYSNNFEQDSDIRNNNSQQAGNGVISHTVFKEGNGSFYAIPENVSSGIRSEIQGFPTPIEGAMEYWAMYQVIVSDNMHSWQIHPGTSGGSSSPGLWHIGGKFAFSVWKSGGNTQYSTGVTIPKNTWNKYRIEYKLSSSGYLRFFVDGVKVFDKSNIQVGDGSTSYGKLGTNGWLSSASESRVFYDQFRVYRIN